uniref:Uncharacterized protein n=1 Tax=Echeneis naucrates TaxID=173247 RepID=A0A665WC20_ECHNA
PRASSSFCEVGRRLSARAWTEQLWLLESVRQGVSSLRLAVLLWRARVSGTPCKLNQTFSFHSSASACRNPDDASTFPGEHTAFAFLLLDFNTRSVLQEKYRASTEGRCANLETPSSINALRVGAHWSLLTGDAIKMDILPSSLPLQ